MKKIVSLILSVCTLCGIAACTTPSADSSSTDNGAGNSSSQQSSSQQSPITNTDYKLVNNGKSDYKIVIEDEASLEEDEASWELEDYFKEAASVKIKTVYESEVTYSDDAKLIILGDTKYTENSGVDVSKIPHDGFTLKTVGSNVFILGENAGVLYGAYEFLSQTLGFEYFVDGVYTLDKNVKDLYLPNLNFSDAPDFMTRADGWEQAGEVATRSEGMFDPFIKPVGEPIHNTFNWLPKDDYQSAHPGWYSTNGKQLCYTARGDNNELALMRATVLAKFKERVKVYFGEGSFDNNVISFTQQDDTSWCSCSGCTAVMNAAGGAGSATVIKFLNPIARDLQAWVDVEYPGREVGVTFFAYHGSNKAPINVEMEDNVYVWLCLPTADTLRSMSDPANASHKQNLEEWAALSKRLYLWRFDANWHNYLLWWDTIGSMQDFYRTARDLGAVYVFQEGLKNDTAYTGFNMFKAALNYKLMWDVDADVEAFTERFFNAYFMDAAEPMLDYYNSFRAWSTELIKNGYAKGAYGGTSQFNGFNASHWPIDKLDAWSSYVDEAYGNIMYLEEEDPDLYDELYTRITLESIAIRYAKIQFYGGTTEMKLAFKEDATALGIVRESQVSNMEKLYYLWGLR